jgi:hypothetical protein
MKIADAVLSARIRNVFSLSLMACSESFMADTYRFTSIYRRDAVMMINNQPLKVCRRVRTIGSVMTRESTASEKRIQRHPANA